MFVMNAKRQKLVVDILGYAAAFSGIVGIILGILILTGVF
jgi:hypothetical protein